MNGDEYDRWWLDNTDGDGEVLAELPEPISTLAAHVMALQARIDRLPDPDEHDQAHGRGCRCAAVQCACAYDHPNAVCMVHHEAGVPGSVAAARCLGSIAMGPNSTPTVCGSTRAHAAHDLTEGDTGSYPKAGEQHG